jgi:hypothetical protein
MIQPHGGMPEESDVGGGVPWPTLVEALGAAVDASSVGASDVGSGVGSADVVSGSGDSLVGSGAADDEVGSGAAEDDVGLGVAEVVDGVGDADSASLALSVGSAVADSVGVAVAVSLGVSLGGSDVRLGSEGSEGSERDGVGRVGRSLGSEMPPLPHPVTSPTTSAAPAAPVRSFDRTLNPVPPGGLSRRGYLSTDRGVEGASAPTRDLRVGASSAAAWLAGTREGVGEGRGCSRAVAGRRGRAEHGAG